MKLNKTLIIGLSALALASCNDFLDVDAPSKNDLEYVFQDKTEINRALNNVYACLLSDKAFGSSLLSTFCLNSDVDFYINSSEYALSNQYRRFDCDADGGELMSTWTALYQGIESANIIIDQIPQSSIYMTTNIEGVAEPDEEMVQMLGEAKVLRAILYHELTWMFGDVPFSMEPSYNSEMVFPVSGRTEMLAALINDLKGIADNMKYASELTAGVERVSKEACWAVIARLALTAGGYSLYPDGDTYGKMQRPANSSEFYNTALEYSKKVIDSGTHSLSKPYYKVFYDECNFVVDNSDDVIFEIPFAKESTGQIGYIQGPQLVAASGETLHVYGESSGNARLNSLYRFSFDENDARRDYVNQLFYYTQTNVATLHNDRTVYNGKWSKLWVSGGLGSSSTKYTGINYPYMRYADVLLMFAEAVNEVENGLNGAHGSEAKSAIAQVRNRAFQANPEMVEPYIASHATSKEDALKMILDERKWEFAGENMRWRDLVRNNLYNEIVYWTFFRYYSVAESAGATSDYIDHVSNYDFGHEDGYLDLPYAMYYKNDVDNLDSETGLPYYTAAQFPNQTVKVTRIANPYKRIDATVGAALGISKADYMNWYDDNLGLPQVYFLYSLRGYIYGDSHTGILYINNNGNYTACPEPSAYPTAQSLPVVRYILPYPRSVLTHSNGQYVNKYGYR